MNSLAEWLPESGNKLRLLRICPHSSDPGPVLLDLFPHLVSLTTLEVSAAVLSSDLHPLSYLHASLTHLIISRNKYDTTLPSEKLHSSLLRDIPTLPKLERIVVEDIGSSSFDGELRQLCKSRGIVLSVGRWGVGSLVGWEGFAELLDGCVLSSRVWFVANDVRRRSRIVDLDA